MDRTGVRYALGHHLEGLGILILRYGLLAILLWIGAFKFTATEAKAIQPLISHSPLMSWLYAVTDVQGASRLIGATELTIAILIATRPWSAVTSALGSLAATGMFLTTLSFLVTTPGTLVWVEGFLAPSEVGAFLAKDLFLLGAAVLTAGESLQAAARGHEMPPATIQMSASRS
jgi:uncharacterized membrane protein YkgB